MNRCFPSLDYHWLANPLNNEKAEDCEAKMTSHQQIEMQKCSTIARMLQSNSHPQYLYKAYVTLKVNDEKITEKAIKDIIG